MKKRILGGLAIFLGFFSDACILPDKGICILDKGYNWCMNSAGAIGKNGILLPINVNAPPAPKGCVCLPPADNETMETKGHTLDLDPGDDNTAIFQALRYQIGGVAKVLCEKTAADKGWVRQPGPVLRRHQLGNA